MNESMDIDMNGLSSAFHIPYDNLQKTNREKNTGDLIDKELSATADLENLKDDDVIVEVPQILFAVDENKEDISIPNLRVVSFETFKKIQNWLLQIDFNASFSNQIKISREIVQLLITQIKSSMLDSNKSSPDTTQQTNDSTVLYFMNLIEHFIQCSENMQYEDNYVNVNTNHLEPTKIRLYKNDEIYGTLISYEDISINYRFPCLTTDVYTMEEINKIRRETNATDVNIFQYVINESCKSLLLHPTRILDSTIQYINISMALIYLDTNSLSVPSRSDNDLKSNYISFIIDFIARTRNIQAWYTHLPHLMINTLNDFDPKSQNLLNVIYAQRDPASRANLFLKYIRMNQDSINEPNSTNGGMIEPNIIKQITEKLSYKKYMDILNKVPFIHIGQNRYVLLSIDFLIKLQTEFSVDAGYNTIEVINNSLVKFK